MATGIGKMLIVAGLAAIGIGLLILYARHLPWLGRLPGDIVIKKENFTFYFPLTSCILASLILSIAIRFFSRK